MAPDAFFVGNSQKFYCVFRKHSLREMKKYVMMNQSM